MKAWDFYCLLVQINLYSCIQEQLFSVCLLVKSSLNRQALLTSVFYQPLSESPLLFQYGFQVPVHILQNLALFPYKIKLQSWTYHPAKTRAKPVLQTERKTLIYCSGQLIFKTDIKQNGFCWSAYDLVSACTQSHHNCFLEM